MKAVIIIGLALVAAAQAISPRSVFNSPVPLSLDDDNLRHLTVKRSAQQLQRRSIGGHSWVRDVDYGSIPEAQPRSLRAADISPANEAGQVPWPSYRSKRDELQLRRRRADSDIDRFRRTVAPPLLRNSREAAPAKPDSHKEGKDVKLDAKSLGYNYPMYGGYGGYGPYGNMYGRYPYGR